MPANLQGICQQPFQAVSPALNDLGPGEYVRMGGTPTGVSGGLYPGGAALPPADHQTAGVELAATLDLLDSVGAPDAGGGKIVLLSIGMSNTYYEFLEFMQLAEMDPALNPSLVLVNGAIGGQPSDSWTDPDDPNWEVVDQRLADAGVTPAQVQVAWLKHAQTGAGDFPDKAQALQGDLEAISRNLLIRYPNIKLAILSSRTRAYRYWTGLSPEPVAFETGFAVRWLIEKQINGDPSLNYDPNHGPVTAPWLAWGPYLWADGLNPRSDGFTWLPDDLAADCIHPSPAGIQKAAGLLIDHFKTDPATAAWFLGEMQYLPMIRWKPGALQASPLSAR